MLLARAPAVPPCLPARRLSLRGLKAMPLSVLVTSTSSWMTSDSSPRLPLTLRAWPWRSTVTPWGTTTGFLPTRDMAKTPCRLLRRRHILREGASGLNPLGVFSAADMGGARLGVRHDAARRGEDRDAEPVEMA